MGSTPPVGGTKMSKEANNISKERLCETIRKRYKEWGTYKKQCTLIREALEMNKIWLKNACKDPDVSLDTCRKLYLKVGDYKKQLNSCSKLCKAAKKSWRNVVSIWSILEKHGYLNEEKR